MKESTRVLVSLGAAGVIGWLISAGGNPSLVRVADSIAPIGTLWLNAIRMTVIPLVVSLLITGVASATDVRAIGRLGGRTLLTFVLLIVGAALVIIPLAPAAFSLLPANIGARPPLPAGAAEAASQLSGDPHQTLGGFISSLLPTNPVAAASSGAMVPLIIFSILFALAIVRSDSKSRETLVSFFQSLGNAMLTLVRWVVLAAPVGVFALILPLAVHAGGMLAGAVGFYIVTYSIACLVVTALLYPVAAIVAGIPIRRFARGVLPSQLIALSSSSSIASLPALVEGAEQGLQLPVRITGFVLPLSVSAFKLASPVSWTVGSLFIGWFYGIPIGAKELGTIAFAAVFLSFAAPGIPRGAFIMLAPLFLAIGLPPEGIGILIAVDALPDVFSTVLNVTGDMTAAAIVARCELPEGAAVATAGGFPTVQTP